MNENEILTIPLVVHENERSRADRLIRRLITVVVVLALLLFTSNVIWLGAYSTRDTSDGTTAAVFHEARIIKPTERDIVWTKNAKTKNVLSAKFAPKANTKRICPI